MRENKEKRVEREINREHIMLKAEIQYIYEREGEDEGKQRDSERC